MSQTMLRHLWMFPIQRNSWKKLWRKLESIPGFLDAWPGKILRGISAGIHGENFVGKIIRGGFLGEIAVGNFEGILRKEDSLDE